MQKLFVGEFLVSTPRDAAYQFSAILAVDKGVQSCVERHGPDYVVVADDGQQVRFMKRGTKCSS